MENQQQHTSSSCGNLLLRLPPELRLEIYRLLLLSDRSVRMTWSQDKDSPFPPNCLFPAILRTCRIIYDEAAGVLYGENVFRSHRIDDTNNNAAFIKRAKLVIGIVRPEDGEDDVSKLQDFLENHPNLEHLVLEFGSNLLEDSKLRDLTSEMLLRSCYTSRLTIYPASYSERSAFQAEKIKSTVVGMAMFRDYFPEGFQKFRDNIKTLYHDKGTCEPGSGTLE
ncbi:MAG: hypothetical protein M1813_005439 [Trichoglossum hirsutum]|jgi:hypothetical protein|nr:MAG: hypothetical protein M1813_005439 [Trichoglossum hirsutum]